MGIAGIYLVLVVLLIWFNYCTHNGDDETYR